jgi:hypothetical protein
MHNVYSNASIVIAANHANNTSVGCFHTRNSRPTAIMELSRFSDKGKKEARVQASLLFPGNEYQYSPGEFPSEPLSTRGWALQERILANRVLHYNTDQMYFECARGIVGEDGYYNKHRLCSLNVQKQPQPERANHETWNHLLRTYGNRKLTNPTDKLPAMSGFAKLFEQRLGAKYVAGLWSDDLIEGLAWQGLGSRRVFSESSTIYTGPSWSWASYDGIAATGGRERGFQNVAEIKDWSMEVKTDANPYGEVKDAWIRVRAPMTKLVSSPLEINDHEIRLGRAGLHPHPRMCTRYSDDENGTIAILDHEETEKLGTWRQWEMELLMLGGYPNKQDVNLTGTKGSDELSPCYCLIVVKTADSLNMDRRKRVGWMFLYEDEAVKLRNEEDNWTTVEMV